MVKPAKVSILMIIVTVIMDRPLEVLESPLGYVPALLPRRCVRELEVDALVDANADYILGCV